MPPLVFIGYEVRERFANEPAYPLPNYPLGFGTSTMDSSLCRPCVESGRDLKGHSVFLHKTLAEVRDSYLAISRWEAHVVGGRNIPKEEAAFAVFAYSLESEIIPRLLDLERRTIGTDLKLFRDAATRDEIQPEIFQSAGFDVVRGLMLLDRWESEVANEGIPRETIERHGVLNEHGLFASYEAAESFKKELISYGATESDPPIIASIHMADFSSLRS